MKLTIINKVKNGQFSRNGGGRMPENLSPKVNEVNLTENTNPVQYLFKSVFPHRNLSKELNLEEYESKALLRSLREAKRELDVARSNFEFAENEEMVDFFIHSLNAAETRFQFLLKKAKEKGISNTDMAHIFTKRR